MIVTVQTIVMMFGGIVAGAGLLLLFLRQEPGRNQVKVFGQEFEVSTPALVVFLCGCSIFVLPLLRPTEALNRPAIVFGSPPAEPADMPSPSREAPRGQVAMEPNQERRPATSGSTAPRGPQASPSSTGSAGVEENEPNDQATQANVMRVGTRVRGVIAGVNDQDFFKFRTPDALPGEIRVIVRKLHGAFGALATVFDKNEIRVASGEGGGADPASFTFAAKAGAEYYLRVQPYYPFKIAKGYYELEVRQD